MAKTIVLKVSTCERIDETAGRMVRKAKETKRPVKAVFNDMCLIATTDSTSEQIVQYYHDELWRESVMCSDKSEEQTEELNAINTHIAKLLPESRFDFSNLAKVIDWLYEFRTMSVSMVLEMGVSVPYSQIVHFFVCHGYLPNENAGDLFDPTDKRVAGRFVIGKALADLQRIPHVLSDSFNYHANEWRERFAT